MTDIERIRSRNTARAQVGVGLACLIVAALLAVVELQPDISFSNLPLSIASLVLLAVWMFRRAWLRRRTLAG